MVVDYTKGFIVKIKTQDPDTEYNWNEDEAIETTLTCLDLSTRKECKYANSKVVKFDPLAQSVHFKRFEFEPFTLQQWKLEGKKGTRNQETFCTVVILDASMEVLNISYPIAYNFRKVNENEEL